MIKLISSRTAAFGLTVLFWSTFSFASEPSESSHLLGDSQHSSRYGSSSEEVKKDQVQAQDVNIQDEYSNELERFLRLRSILSSDRARVNDLAWLKTHQLVDVTRLKAASKSLELLYALRNGSSQHVKQDPGFELMKNLVRLRTHAHARMNANRSFQECPFLLTGKAGLASWSIATIGFLSLQYIDRTQWNPGNALIFETACDTCIYTSAAADCYYPFKKLALGCRTLYYKATAVSDSDRQVNDAVAELLNKSPIYSAALTDLISIQLSGIVNRLCSDPITKDLLDLIGFNEAVRITEQSQMIAPLEHVVIGESGETKAGETNAGKTNAGETRVGEARP